MNPLENKIIDVPNLLMKLGIEAKQKTKGEWWASCPNKSHDDKTPSWSIKDEPGNKRHGYHKCFGCGFGGDCISLVTEVFDIGYYAAIGYLLEHAVDPPIVSSIQWKAELRIKTDFKLPTDSIIAPANSWITPPLKYLKEREMDQFIDQFKLGYAIKGRCQGRVIIPVYDCHDKVVSYTARTYCDHDKRYLEPEKQENADPNAIFGEHLWKDPERMRGVIAVTEGAFNALTAKLIIPNISIGAIFGTSSITPLQMSKIVNNFDRVIIITDNDHAGNIAAEKIEASMTRYIDVVRYELPENVDLNDLYRSDKYEAYSRMRNCLQ